MDFFDNKIMHIVDSFSVDETNPDHRFIRVLERRLLHFHDIDLSNMKDIIHKMKMTHCGNDPFSISEVRNSQNLGDILHVFVQIVNLSFVNNTFLESEKLAIFKPIVKGDLDPQSLISYRPVSNMTYVSKVIENVILDQLWRHLNEVNAIPDDQSAYRRLYSTETTLCTVVNDLLIKMDEGKCNVLIMLDLSATFDTVVHSFLLNDLKRIGIDGNAQAYLESYLKNRMYCVQIGKSFSKKKSLQRGVPQGSILGPILFCIYTIGLSELLTRHGVKLKLFADDTQFYMTMSNVIDVEDRLETVLSDIKLWMDSKQLKLSSSKTELLVVGKKMSLRRMDITTLRLMGTTLDVRSTI